eukprot:556845-Pelagomonas_calceolata.AAC.2
MGSHLQHLQHPALLALVATRNPSRVHTRWPAPFAHPLQMQLPAPAAAAAATDPAAAAVPKDGPHLEPARAHLHPWSLTQRPVC